MTVPPHAQPRIIVQENGPPIVARTPIRRSAAAIFLNNVQIGGELAVPEIVLERTPSPSQVDDESLHHPGFS
jgi:hypothetical protein